MTRLKGEKAADGSWSLPAASHPAPCRSLLYLLRDLCVPPRDIHTLTETELDSRTQSEEHGRETRGWGRPCGDTDTRHRRGGHPAAPRARSTARLTSEVGDVMMSEHGGRAWVLGQGQAATGNNTHSTSCGRQRASQSPCGLAGLRATDYS